MDPRHLKYVLFTGTLQLKAYSHVLFCRFRYDSHLSKEQTAELVAPHPDTLEIVFSWLKYNGVPPSSISQTHGGSWLTIVGVPIFQANQLLGASCELCYHAWANDTILRTVSYALPTALHEVVQTIVPTTAFTLTRLLQQTRLSHSSREAVDITSGEEPSDVLSHRAFKVTPSILHWLYGMPFDNPDPTDRNKLGIAVSVPYSTRELDLPPDYVYRLTLCTTECVTCSKLSVHMESVSLSLGAIKVLAHISSSPFKIADSPPPSLHRVRVMFNFSLQTAHMHWHVTIQRIVAGLDLSRSWV